MTILYFICIIMFVTPFIFWAWFNHTKTNEFFGMKKFKIVALVFVACFSVLAIFISIGALFLI